MLKGFFMVKFIAECVLNEQMKRNYYVDQCNLIW